MMFEIHYENEPGEPTGDMAGSCSPQRGMWTCKELQEWFRETSIEDKGFNLLTISGIDIDVSWSSMAYGIERRIDENGVLELMIIEWSKEDGAVALKLIYLFTSPKDVVKMVVSHYGHPALTLEGTKTITDPKEIPPRFQAMADAYFGSLPSGGAID